MVRCYRLSNIFEVFSCKIGDPHVFSCSGIKVTEGFSIISNLALTTRITINYSRAIFFVKWIFKLKQCIRSALRSKNYFQFAIWQIFFYSSSYLVLKSSESWPKYGRTKVNSLLGTMKLRSFLINNLLNFLLHWFMGVLWMIFVLEYWY